MAVQNEVAAGRPIAVSRKIHRKASNIHQHSATLRSYLQSQPPASGVADDLSRSLAQKIEVDIFRSLLGELVNARDFSIGDVGAIGASGKSLLHYVACGAHDAIVALSELASGTGKAAAKAFLEALQAGDSLLGLTPFHIAFACYRSSPTLLSVAQNLSSTAGLDWQSSDAFLAGLRRDAFGLRPKDYSARLGEDRTEHGSLREYTGSASGRWWVSSYGHSLLAEPPGKCDIAIFDAPVSKQKLAELIVSMTPAVFRGEALKYKLRKKLKAKAFVEEYGDKQMVIGTIPYARLFGLAEQRMTVREFVKQIQELSKANAPSEDAPHYAFGSDLLQQIPELANAFDMTPDLIDGLKVGGQDVQVAARQFYLGPPNSGAPMHFHKEALNVLAYGRKRWFLLPPERAVYSKVPVADWMKAGRAEGSLECVQEAGDVLFVPSRWAHATLNVEASIGVAYELGVFPMVGFG
eukprot:TRINITY_DN100319_c0_g1_i1.p1 TRINITY_DN100319_c0_g1~~TRINITY_DN100319_c0_g1_i1.p1  ORF type:complete len:484 (+),score=90.11 TRINITY_DN100319_c0_g1_i1:59-1453(+)